MPSGDLNQKLSELSDEELAVRSKTDSSALPYLVSRFTKPVLAKACSFAAKYPADADDLLQEGLLAVIKAAETFDPQKGVKLSLANMANENAKKDYIDMKNIYKSKEYSILFYQHLLSHVPYSQLILWEKKIKIL